MDLHAHAQIKLSSLNDAQNYHRQWYPNLLCRERLTLPRRELEPNDFSIVHRWWMRFETNWRMFLWCRWLSSNFCCCISIAIISMLSFRLNHFTLLSMEPKRASNQILVRDICRETAGEHLNRHISLRNQMVWSSPRKTKGKSQETDAPKPGDLLPRWKIPISGTDNSTMQTDQRWPVSFSETRRSENRYSEKTAEEKIILAFTTTRRKRKMYFQDHLSKNWSECQDWMRPRIRLLTEELPWSCQTFLNRELKKILNPKVSLDSQIDGCFDGIAVIQMSQSSFRYLSQRIGPSYVVSRLHVRDLWEISTRKRYIPSFRRVPGWRSFWIVQELVWWIRRNLWPSHDRR